MQLDQAGARGHGELRAPGTDAVFGYALGRAGFLGHAGGYSLELGLGAGTDFEDTIAAGQVGLFWGLYYFELGASVFFPIGANRPPWIGSLQFGLRVWIPVHTYGQYDERDHAREERERRARGQ